MRTKSEVDEAFVEFVRTHEHALRRMAYLISGDRQLAEDAVQVALMKLYLSWSRIDKRESIGAYARRTVVNAVLDQKRRPWRREHGVEHLPDSVAAGSDHAEQTGQRLLLKQALAALPARQRAVVILRFIEDLDVDTTATTMRCRPGTVMSTTSSALAALRRFLISHGVVRGTAHKEQQ